MIFQTILIRKVADSRLSSSNELFSTPFAAGAASVSFLIALTLFRKGADVLSSTEKRKTNLTRLPPHSFTGFVFVTQTGRVHNKDWHSWNAQSRPGCVCLCLPPITKASIQRQWLLCFTAGMQPVNSFARRPRPGLLLRFRVKTGFIWGLSYLSI